jgi:acetoin utilization deacetylase AcuC-like enzyme
MKATAVVFAAKYLDHKTGRGHPESPARLRAIVRELNKSGLLETGKCSLVEPESASVEDVQLVHESDYIQLVQRVCASGGGLLDLGDTVVSSESFEVALLAVGGAIKAVDLVMAEKSRNAFALLRPPGHHAGRYYALGFCIFNNAAIAAAHLLRNFKLERILILDIDAHHGNGTQEIFYDSNKVLYVSLHQDPLEFPGTGFIDDVGEGKGLGYTVNIPLPFGISDKIYFKAFNQIVVPVIQQYKPQFMIVSTGFDNHYGDPVASLSVSATSYVETFGKVLELASSFCSGKLVAVLEGGYNMRILGRMAVAVISNMAEVPYFIRDKRSVSGSRIRKQSERIIERVKEVQSSFWDF